MLCYLGILFAVGSFLGALVLWIFGEWSPPWWMMFWGVAVVVGVWIGVWIVNYLTRRL